MKLIKTALVATAATIAMTGAANAAEWSFNLGAATEYVFRGIDQTTVLSDGEFFGGADVAFGADDQFYAGVWVSTTGPDFDDGFEYDIYGGWKTAVGGVNLDLGLLYYAYNNSDLGFVSDDYNTLELKVAASVPVGMATLGGAIYYSPDFAGTDESSLYVEANLATTLERGWTISGAVGNFSSDAGFGADDYFTYNVGVTFPVGDQASIDVRYIGAEDEAGAFGTEYDGLVGTLKLTF